MSATTRTTSEQTEAPAVESSSSSLPQGIKDIMAAMPRYQVVNITKEDIEAEGRMWEPKVPFAGLDYHHVVLQEFYETNIFQPTTDEVTWLFLDKLGPERAKMLRTLYIHANQEFEDGTWVGIDGPVFQIGWNRQQKPKGSGRWHVHKDAVQIRLHWHFGAESETEWVPLTAISDLQLLGGDYDWTLRPKTIGEHDYLTFLEETLWTAQAGT